VAKNPAISMAFSLLAAGLIAGGVQASPVSMSLSSAPSSATSNSWWQFWKPSTTPTPPVWQSAPISAGTPISPIRHPIDYVSAKWHGTPTPGSQSATPTPTPTYHDSIALNTPAGPPTPELFIAMAQIAERQGNVPQARQQLQHALSMWPNNIDLLRAAGRMEDRAGNLPLAETLYQRAVTANPQHAGALNDLGVCMAREGKLEQSVQTLEQAAYLQPNEARYRNNVATVLVELRQDQRALAHLSAVRAPAEANYNLGQLLVERNRPQEAAKYFQAALGIDPAMQPAQKALAELNMAVPGQPAVATAQTTVAPSAGEIAPMNQLNAPQQAGNQATYPEMARAPMIGQSTAAPPTVAPQIRTANVPRYLPSTAQPASGNMVR
jgi:tetratricopeptide (TPR) repeat protein